MKRIMCYCLAISLIHHGSSELDCTEPQLLVKHTHCIYDNLTSLSMYTFNEEFKVNLAETSTHKGCDIDFAEPYFNDTFYIECEIAETNCFDEDREVKQVKNTYYVECEEVYNYTTYSSAEIDVYRNETTTDFAVVTDTAVNFTDVDVFSNESAVTVDSWSTFRIETTSKESFEIDEFRNETAAFVLKEVKEDSSESSKVLPVLGYSAATLGAIMGVALGICRLRNLMQSGSYLLPNSPNQPNFIELA